MFRGFNGCNNQKIQQVQKPAAKILRITMAPLSTKNKTALYTYRDVSVKQYFWPGKIFMCRNFRFSIVTKIYVSFFSTVFYVNIVRWTNFLTVLKILTIGSHFNI